MRRVAMIKLELSIGTGTILYKIIDPVVFQHNPCSDELK